MGDDRTIPEDWGLIPQPDPAAVAAIRRAVAYAIVVEGEPATHRVVQVVTSCLRFYGASDYEIGGFWGKVAAYDRYLRENG